MSKSFEGTKPCNATTPVGHAIGCPGQYQSGRLPSCIGCNAHMNDVNSTICDLIYVGHNLVGNEMHWLPPKYLSRWWHLKWHYRNINNSSSSDIISLSSSSSLSSSPNSLRLRIRTHNPYHLYHYLCFHVLINNQ